MSKTYVLHIVLHKKDIGLVAQLVRAPPCHGGGRRFESDRGRYGILAQLGEHLPYKQRVTGSSPVGPIFKRVNDFDHCPFIVYGLLLYRYFNHYVILRTLQYSAKSWTEQ